MLLLTPCGPGSGFPRSVSLRYPMCRRICFWCCKTFQDSYCPSSSSSSSIFIHPIYQRFSAGITTVQQSFHLSSSRQLSFLSIGTILFCMISRRFYWLHASVAVHLSTCCSFFLPFDCLLLSGPTSGAALVGQTIRALVHCVLLRSFPGPFLPILS